MANTTDGLIDALYEAAEEYGVTFSTGEQAAVARLLTAMSPGSLNAKAVESAFVTVGIRRPPSGYGSSVVRRTTLYGKPRSLLDIVLDYRQFAIENLSRKYGGGTRVNEGDLRDSLHTYLPQHGYKEAQNGRGNTDLLVPDSAGGNRPEAIIETKVWKGESDYEDGLEELAAYIRTAKPRRAVYVVFSESNVLPKIIKDPTQAIAEWRTLSGLVVPVVVIPFEQVVPSKVRRTRRKAVGR